MGSYVIRVKVLPADVNDDLEKIVESVRAKLLKDMHIRGKKIEPIAFGLSAIILDIVAPEEEGSIEDVERLVSTAPMVGQIEMMGVSRMSSKLPPQ
ncbi:MAG: elongation factor 1-beta [Thaumarchaeota archaeon]|nr:elongation factor 1-beta [Nitrososphaerota archaeon]